MLRHDHLFQATDGDFHFIDWGGSGPLAHFSHATGLCAGTYTPLAQRLNSHLRVLGMDDRGHGMTKAPANPHKLKNWDIFVKDLEPFFDFAAFVDVVVVFGPKNRIGQASAHCGHGSQAQKRLARSPGDIIRLSRQNRIQILAGWIP
jgi:hypothetical protein